MERVACYIRVSTQEQKLHGISLEAQRDKLTEYAQTHSLKIVKWYEDEGISGRKLIKNRPALQEMLIEAKAGLFDRIIFIKLDRFFRSVAEYHECMKMIEPVVWTATEEKYDLTTANGRAFVNMKLTIAELEADQTGERIQIVNDYKVKTGQALTGSHSQGLAFTVQVIGGVKRVVPDPDTKDMIIDFINHFLLHHNQQQAYKYAKEKYGSKADYDSFKKVLRDTKLYGAYRSNPNYCEAYIDQSTFEEIQSILSKNIKTTPRNRLFMFAGLIKCPKCGRTLSGKHGTNKYHKDYYYYRCNVRFRDHNCTFTRQLNEDKIEAQLIAQLDEKINQYIINAEEIIDNSSTPEADIVTAQIEQVKREMKNTTISFNKGRMTEREYDLAYEDLEDRLKELESKLQPVQVRDLTIYKELQGSNWLDLYKKLDKEHRRVFWRKYLREIKTDISGKEFTPLFF